ncbi:hypothetical protein B0H14DRAFT_3065127 [Mycena olivaceomarginata]|nr:hypothetical protein B0H14DRAFT_3065127 [Mycena olivaceomarginata]
MRLLVVFVLVRHLSCADVAASGVRAGAAFPVHTPAVHAAHDPTGHAGGRGFFACGCSRCQCTRTAIARCERLHR